MHNFSSRPTWIRLLLVNGNPDGIRIVEKANWTGVAIVASRADFKEVIERDELGRPGVYVLTGESKHGSPLIYIGEADILYERLKQHNFCKDFWTMFVAFTSSNEDLNKAHVRYLEARLVKLAKSANQWEVENNHIPSIPKLSEADKAYADYFFNEMLVIYPLLGIDAFEDASKNHKKHKDSELLYLSQRGAKAKGKEVPEGFVVMKGSLARLEVIPSARKHIHNLRNQLISRNVLLKEKNRLVFMQDYRFNSPSTAAAVLVGGSINGRTAWKNFKDITLKEIQKQK
ncbi:MAG: GIY-YIG nuclease family protein [Kosmotoga sp.]|nr:MAG: GIY-YIG nuclease family protein [Kosmotoga sp.]